LLIMLFTLLYITSNTYSDKTLIVSNKFIYTIFVITLFFLWTNTICFLFRGLIQFSLIELLTATIWIQNVFYTADGFSFTELRYITLLNCLIKSLLFLLISVLILIINISINLKSSVRLCSDSIIIQIFLIISNLSFIIYMKSSFFYYLFINFGSPLNELPCEILIHNYNFIVFAVVVFLYIFITILLLALPLTAGVNTSLALVKEIFFMEFVHYLCYFTKYTISHRKISYLFIDYPFLIPVLTDEIYSFPLNMVFF